MDLKILMQDIVYYQQLNKLNIWELKLKLTTIKN